MEQPSQQATAIKQEFGTRRNRQILLSIAIIGSFILGAVALGEKGQAILGAGLSAVLGPVIVLFGVFALGLSFWNWRCPACGRYLGRAMNPKFCAKCGVALR